MRHRQSSRTGPLSWLALALALSVSMPWGSTAAQESRPAPVQVIVARETPIRQVLELAGTVVAARAASLSPATSGLVASLRVDVGDVVERGDPLLQLDDELALLRVAGDKAAARRARAARADSRRRLAEARELVLNKTIAESAVRALETEVSEDEAELARRLALSRLSAATLERHTLAAPFGGVVSERQTDLGEWIAPGDTVLRLVSLEQLFVDLQLPESYLGAVRSGMPLRLRLAGSGDETLDAAVHRVVPVTDPTARTFLVRVVAKDPQPGMLPGVSARASLPLDAGYSRVAVPRDAILRYADGRSVAWVIGAVDGIERADERPVETGLSFDGRVEVIRGIRPGERVAVVGNESLRDDQPVTVVNGDF